MQTPILKGLPRRRSRRRPSSASLCRSSRLAVKSHLRAVNATLQARKVLPSKWDPTTPEQQPDTQVLNAFQQALQVPLDSSKEASTADAVQSRPDKCRPGNRWPARGCLLASTASLCSSPFVCDYGNYGYCCQPVANFSCKLGVTSLLGNP